MIGRPSATIIISLARTPMAAGCVSLPDCELMDRMVPSFYGP